VYLIDTNILSYFVKSNQKVVEKFALHSQEIYLCSVVQAECFYGAKKIASLGLVKNYDLIFENFPNLAFDFKASNIFSDLKVALSNKGKSIEDFDLMIASICLANELTLVTNNIKHFQEVPDLVVVDWSV
jgi:tRNA(fMet)-specific endonuclease VapC